MSERIAVIGLGYVGLPVALAFAKQFVGTVAFDIDRRRVDELRADRETLRSLRAVGVLEDIGSREARAVLEPLAGGADGARLTREVKASLERMGRPLP